MVMEKVLRTHKINKYFYDPVKFQVLKEIDLTSKQRRISFTRWKIRLRKIHADVHPLNNGYRL